MAFHKTFVITEAVHTSNASDGVIPSILNFHTNWYRNVKPRSVLLNHRQNTNIFIRSQEVKFFNLDVSLLPQLQPNFNLYH